MCEPHDCLVYCPLSRLRAALSTDSTSGHPDVASHLIPSHPTSFRPRDGITTVCEPRECRNVSPAALSHARLLQSVVQSSPLPAWHKQGNHGFWRLLTVGGRHSLPMALAGRWSLLEQEAQHNGFLSNRFTQYRIAVPLDVSAESALLSQRFPRTSPLSCRFVKDHAHRGVMAWQRRVLRRGVRHLLTLTLTLTLLAAVWGKKRRETVPQCISKKAVKSC